MKKKQTKKAVVEPVPVEVPPTEAKPKRTRKVTPKEIEPLMVTPKSETEAKPEIKPKRVRKQPADSNDLMKTEVKSEGPKWVVDLDNVLKEMEHIKSMRDVKKVI